MSHSVRRHLRVDVDAYDRSIRQFIPGYEDMLAQVARATAELDPEHVVDLGAGTGALAQAVLQHCPRCTVELIDVDAEMLDQARERLAPFGSRVRFSQRPFQAPLPRCDVIVASLALHHIPTLREKEVVFGAIHAALHANGAFVNADANMPIDAAKQRADYRTWTAHLVASGIAEDRAWQHFREWADEDTFLPIEDELSALRAVGFDAVRIWHCVPISVVKSIKTH